jgi:hypothetical protein
LYHPFQERRVRTVAYSSSVNLSWFWLILGRWIDVHWRCKLKFLLDLFSNGVVKSCSSLFVNDTPTVLMVKKGTSLVLIWDLHLQWLRDIILQSWLFMISWDIVGNPPLIDVCWHQDACHGVMASRHPYHCCWCARWCLRRWWKQVSDWLIRSMLHLASHQHPSLNLGKAQC